MYIIIIYSIVIPTSLMLLIPTFLFYDALHFRARIREDAHKKNVLVDH